MDNNENDEKKSKTTVKEYIDELEKVLSDPEKLTYEETKQYMDVAYEAISLNSAEDNEENAIILKSIMDRLSVISTLKKPKPNNKVIPKPVFDNKESKKEEEIPVAKTAVSVTEPSKEEIDKAISAQNEAKQNVTYNQTLVINESNKNEVSNDTIDTDNVVNDKMKEEENETVSMEIDGPSIEEQIFVSNDDDVDNKETSSPKDIYEYYGVEKTNEPFEGDDDLDVDPDALEADSGSVDNGLKVSDQDEKEKQLGKKTMTAMDISEYEPSLKDDAPSVVEAEALPEDMTKADAEEETSEAISMGFQPELNFNEDSTLVMPLVGDILLNYSADKSIYFPTLKQYKVNPAVMIATAEGTSVSAGADGLVKRIYDSPVTGKTIVMDLGNGYELTYGQLKDVSVSEGSYVKTGDILGEVGSPTRYFSVEGTHLYMKLTKEGVPQNPLG